MKLKINYINIYKCAIISWSDKIRGGGKRKKREEVGAIYF